MAISEVGTSAAASGTTPQTLTLQTGWTDDDYHYVRLVIRGGSSVTLTADNADAAEYTEVKRYNTGASAADDVAVFLLRRKMAAGDGNPTWSWTGDGGNNAKFGHIMLRGVHTTDPNPTIGAGATTTSPANGVAGDIPATAITVANAGAWVLGLWGGNNALSANTDPADYTSEAESTTRPAAALFSKLYASTGTTGTINYNITPSSNGASGKWGSFLVEVRPTPGPATRTFTAQLQAVAYMTATLTVTTPPPVVPDLPKLNIIVNWEGTQRTIGPGMNTEGFVLTEFGDEIPGGYSDLEFLILATEYDTYKTTVYKYMADVKVKIDASETADGGTVIYQGFLLNPSPGPEVTVPNADGTGTITQGTYIIKCVGYQQLVKDRESPMPWQTRYLGDMFTGSDEPADDTMENADSIQINVKAGSVTFNIPKGTEIKQGDRSGVYLWAGEEEWIKVHRMAGRTVKKKAIPGGNTSPNYALKAVRYQGPGVPSSRYVVSDITDKLYTIAVATFDITMGNERPMVGFELIRTGLNVDETLASYKFSIKGLRFNGNNLVAADTHSGRAMVLDMASRLNFGTARVATLLNDGVTAIPNMLPLWWVGESWELLFEYLAQGLAFKWGIWEIGANGPIIEFRGWEDSNTTWYVDAYGPTAFCKAELKPADNDKYSHVIVFYKLVGKAKWLRKTVPINPNPFAGLNPPRERPFKFVIPDPVPDTTLPTQIANQLAAEYAVDVYSGTIDLSYAYDAASGGNPRTAQLIHSGQKVQVRDFPGGPKTFRIYRTYKSEANVRLEMGRIPLRVDKLLWWQQRRRMMLGKIASMG